MTLKDLLISLPALSTLMNCKELPGAMAFRLGRLSRDCQAHLDQYNAALTKLHERYGKKNDVKNDRGERMAETWTPFADKADEFKAEHEGLLAETLDMIMPVVHAQDITAAKLSPSEYGSLWWLITEDSPAPAPAPASPKAMRL